MSGIRNGLANDIAFQIAFEHMPESVKNQYLEQVFSDIKNNPIPDFTFSNLWDRTGLYQPQTTVLSPIEPITTSTTIAPSTTNVPTTPANNPLNDIRQSILENGLYGSQSPKGYFYDKFGNLNWGKISNLGLGLANLGLGAMNAFNAFKNTSLAKQQLRDNRIIAMYNADMQRQMIEENRHRGSGAGLALGGNHSQSGLAKAKEEDEKNATPKLKL